MDALKMGVKMDILLYLQLPINNTTWTCRFKERLEFQFNIFVRDRTVSYKLGLTIELSLSTLF